MVRDAERLGSQFKGEVVAVSSHHAMLQVGDMVVVRYERADLDGTIGRKEGGGAQKSLLKRQLDSIKSIKLFKFNELVK